jgi:hypothetical protein
MSIKTKTINEHTKTNQPLVPFSIIELAARGDAEAINTVLKHFRGYITTLSTKKLCDEYGNPYICIDEGLRRRLETKLITAICTFDAA